MDMSDQPEMGISAVLPAFNEAENLAAVVQDLKKAMDQLTRHYEIIIVDDGSTDKTVAVSEDLSRDDLKVRLLRHPRNLGYGAALGSGFKAARLPWIFFTDSDGQFDLSELAKLAEKSAGHDFVAGFRAMRADPLLRRAYGFIFSALVRALFKVKATDINCAFKLFKRDLIEDHEFKARGALFNAELLAVARQKGVDPIEVAVTHRPRLKGKNTGGSARVIIRAGKEILALWLSSRKGLKE
jgi:glycosyltransferase involved in cell wall biosynthesis